MATFEQVYWYLHACPLRKLDAPLFLENESASTVRDYIHKHVLNVFDDIKKDIIRAVVKELNIKQLKRGISSEQLTKRIYKALVNISIWKVKHHKSTILDKNVSAEISNLRFSVDIARIKKNMNRLQLIWFRYDTLMPTKDIMQKLVEYAHWNARGYELYKKTRPMQLTYYFPLLGVEYSVLYNTDGKYEAIAKLVDDEVFPIKPSPICDFCNECSMSWLGYKETTS